MRGEEGVGGREVKGEGMVGGEDVRGGGRGGRGGVRGEGMVGRRAVREGGMVGRREWWNKCTSHCSTGTAYSVLCCVPGFISCVRTSCVKRT